MELTNENNKLIAKFMGEDSNYYQNHYYSKTDLAIPPNQIEWNWLMEVVEKIESLYFEVLIGRISCQINEILNRKNPISVFVCGDITSKKEIVYMSVIQFIKWYNQNK